MNKAALPVRLVLLCVLPLVLLGSAAGQPSTLDVDAAASQVAFLLEGSAHSTHGTFQVQSGAVRFDPEARQISGLVVVAAGSGRSGNESRDKKMHADILDSMHFAEVSFQPKSYQGTIAPQGDSTIQVAGIFTLHGTAHDITIPMQIHLDGANCTVKTHFAVPYVQWGLKDPSVFILKVAKEVAIDLRLVGRVAAAK